MVLIPCLGLRKPGSDYEFSEKERREGRRERERDGDEVNKVKVTEPKPKTTGAIVGS